MPRVTFYPSGKSVDVAEELSLLEAARRAGATHVECCGITPACGKCRVVVIEGEDHLSTPDELERAKSARLKFLMGERFGCMAHVLGDVEVEVAQ